MAVQSALVDHMVSIPAVFGGNVEDYLAHTNMNRSGTWENTEQVKHPSVFLYPFHTQLGKNLSRYCTPIPLYYCHPEINLHDK